MPRTAPPTLLLAIVAALLAPSAAHPTTPTAYLSWSRDALVEDLAVSPGDRTPLYLRISSPPPGFIALGTELVWTPNDIFGPCYGVFSDSTIGQPDGWWEYWSPPLELGADSSFYYKLHPRTSGGDIVIRMMVGGGACDARPATICIKMVKFVEANGDTTYAQILGGATIFGGDVACGVEMQQISPTVVGQSEATTFNVIGGGFGEGTTARLVAAGETRAATTVAVLSPGHVQATFDTRDLQGRTDIHVTNAAGDSDSTTALITIDTATPIAYEATSVILWTKPGRLTLPAGSVGATLAESSGDLSLTALLAALGVEEIRSCSPATFQDPEAAARLDDHSQLDIFRLTLADSNVVASCAALSSDTANTIVCHPNWLFHATDVVPMDALMPKSWHLRNTGTFPAPNAVIGADSRASRAWDLSTGGTPVRVGVIDTGSWPAHPDLVGRYSNGWTSPSVYGPDDRANHGTPVAGIIAAVGNGGGQAVGVNWSAEITSIKAVNDGGHFEWSDVIAAIDWARWNGIKFVNMSFAGPMLYAGYPWLDLEVVLYNAFHAGVLLVAGSGNHIGDTPQAPADIYPYVVSVGACLWDGTRWSDNNIHWTDWWGYTDSLPGFGNTTGLHLRFLAPGGRFVPTTKGITDYANPNPALLWSPLHADNKAIISSACPFWGFGGTSAAAPVVTGAASLIRSVAGDSLGAEEITHLLGMTARPTDPRFPGYNTNDGWGMIDIENALWAVRPGMQIERGVAIGGVVADTSAGPIVDIIYWPGLPSYQDNCKSSVYNIRRRVDFAQPFLGRPLVLKRTHGSLGTQSIPSRLDVDGRSPRWEPFIDTLAAYPDSCVLTTRIYALYNGNKFWWPCSPEEVRFAYTLVGAPQSALAVGEPRGRSCARLTVGPTPTRDAVTAELAGFEGREVVLDLLDVQGRHVRSFSARSLVQGTARLELRLGGGSKPVNAGLYFLRARTPSETVTRRVVVFR